MLSVTKPYHCSVPKSSLPGLLRWTDAGLLAVRSTGSHTEESVRDIYLDMRICSLEKPESHLAEELKGGGNIFCGIFFPHHIVRSCKGVFVPF
jgi:hypothetical protein